MNFLDAYLAPRKGKVVGQDSSSEEFLLEDTVIQGTVLGPPLWNSFFADVPDPASDAGGTGTIFANDLNTFHEFDRRTPLADIISEQSGCRRRVRSRGVTNGVRLDPAKAHLLVIHPDESHGELFKILGLMMDLNLRMHSAIDQLLNKIRTKTTAILRTRAYYSVPALVNHYKIHI